MYECIFCCVVVVIYFSVEFFDPTLYYTQQQTVAYIGSRHIDIYKYVD